MTKKKTGIQWTDRTWNPITGCDRVSPGCGLPRPGSDDEATGRTGGCYALELAARLKKMQQPKYQRDGNSQTSGPGFAVTVHPTVVNAPLRWRKRELVFVNSMSDLFHSGVDDAWIADIFAVMAAARQTFQVLTKRHGRMASLLGNRTWIAGVRERAIGKGLAEADWRWPLTNVWMGVSIEDQTWAERRIPALLDTPAAVRFLSAEPLLGPIDLHGQLFPEACSGGCGCRWPDDADASECGCGGPCGGDNGVWPGPPGIDWVIAGGESGPLHRPVELDWVRDLRDQCVDGDVPFFYKQAGGHTPKSGGRTLDGRTWDQMPVSAPRSE